MLDVKFIDRAEGTEEKGLTCVLKYFEPELVDECFRFSKALRKHKASRKNTEEEP
jgi:hypothetical protein